MALPRLNLPDYSPRMRSSEGSEEIWDPVRKKYVALIPEEWIRQNFILYLNKLGYPLSLMKVEGGISYNRKSKRPDILIYSNEGKPLVLVECKTHDTKITQKVFEQASVYNKVIGAQYLIVTNGMAHFCCTQPSDAQPAQFLDHIPRYQELINT